MTNLLISYIIGFKHVTIVKLATLSLFDDQLVKMNTFFTVPFVFIIK